MKIEFDQKELELVLESLEYSKRKFEEYEGYPSENFRNERIGFVSQLIDKLKELKQ